MLHFGLFVSICSGLWMIFQERTAAAVCTFGIVIGLAVLAAAIERIERE